MGAREKRIVLVDDEPSILDPLTAYLSDNGFDVTAARNADEGRAAIDRDQPDLAIFDIMMPGEDGLSLTRDILSRYNLPIILLTAKSEDLDRIIGLELGVDDYVPKPFNPRELLARIKAVLRRANGSSVEEGRERFEFEGFVLDVSTRTLSDKDGQDIELTGGEFSLLQALAERPGRVLNRDQLLDMTQGREANVFDRSVDNQISRLRKKIEENPKSPQLIKTVRGGGYILSAKVTRK